MDAATLAARFAVPAVIAAPVTTSTLDDAHRLAESGALDSTVILADRQDGGRGRHGRRWESEAGQGVWLTILAREVAPPAIPVLSIRLGIAVAAALDSLAGETVQLKWPNDLYLAGGKLAGVLVEARWQGDRVAWLAAGLGINVRPPAAIVGAAALCPGVRRLQVLDVVIPAIVRALAMPGPLDHHEIRHFASRDLALGRAITEPARGTVLGISHDGALRVLTEHGEMAAHVGSLVLDPPFPFRTAAPAPVRSS